MENKSRGIAFLLCLFGFVLGLHNWYLGNYKRAILFTFTAGGFGFWWFSDLMLIVKDYDYIENYYNGHKEYKEHKIQKQEERLEKITELRERNFVQQDHQVRCPKCGGTQLSANKKGFGLAKGAAGVLTFGTYGVLAAGIGKNKILITCLNCGKQFKPGKGR